MARSSGGSAGVFVAGLTAVALAVVGFLAFQASAAADRTEQRPRAGAEAQPDAKASPSPSASASRKKRERTLPADSGTGERVVYALERRRVWLVSAGEQVTRTFEVWPSTVDPPPGQYRVTSRSSHVTGSDGVAVENVVRFATVGETVIGFSASLDGTRPEPDPAKKTGGVRERRADGEAMWLFATIGTRVVVVP